MLVFHQEASIVTDENSSKSTELGVAMGPGHTNEQARPAEPARSVEGWETVEKVAANVWAWPAGGLEYSMALQTSLRKYQPHWEDF